MTLDPTTLFVIGGLVTILSGIFFLLETLLRRNDAVGRLWSVFYIGAMFVVFAYLIVEIDPGTWWALAPANGGFVVAMGMIWSGARAANGMRPLVLVPFAAGAIVGVATLIPGESGGYWAGSLETFIGISAFAGLAAGAMARRDLARLVGARIFAILLAAISIFYAARAVAFLALGPGDATFLSYFGTETSTIFETCLLVLGTVTLSSIQAERFGAGGGSTREIEDGTHLDGVLGLRSFREFAESWLLRSLRERTTLVLLVLEISDLDEINVAFGRGAGDNAIRVTARVATTTAPTATLIGRISARRFALLMKLPSNDSVDAIASRIGDAVLDSAVDDRDRFRVTTFRGIASTRTAGSRFDDLVRAATDALALDAAEARQKAALAQGTASAS